MAGFDSQPEPRNVEKRKVELGVRSVRDLFVDRFARGKYSALASLDVLYNLAGEATPTCRSAGGDDGA